MTVGWRTNLEMIAALVRRAANELLRVPGAAIPGVLAPTIFFLVVGLNLTSVIPFLNISSNARIGMPIVLAALAYVVFNYVGIKKYGFFRYVKSSIVVPNLPPALHVLVIPIEFISTFLVRPFSLTVRLFANMLAGHILLVTFALLTEAMFQAETNRPFLNVLGVLPFGMLIFLTAFEVLVGFLQAYIFTILAAVYIGGAAHPDH